MPEITLADGRNVREIRAFINGRWYKTKGNIFHNGKWIEFSRPEIQFKDDFITTTGMRRQTIKTYVKEPVSIGQRTLLLQSSAGFYENEEVTITDGLNSEDVRIVGRNLISNSSLFVVPSFRRQLSSKIKKNQTYTISFDYEILEGEPSSFLLYGTDGSNSNPLWRNISIPSKPKGCIRYTFIPTADRHVPFLYLYTGENAAESRGVSVRFKNMKLEKGTTPSPWTPAPEDIYGTADNVISITPTKNSYRRNSIVGRTNLKIKNNKLTLPTYKTYSVYDIVKNGLILHLDGRTGKDKDTVWKDLSGNGNDGELKNFDFTENSGWVDGGLRFDGGTVVTKPNFDFGISNFSIEWMGVHYDYTYPRSTFLVRNNNLAYRSGRKGFQIGHYYSSSGVNIVINDGSNLVRRSIGRTPGINEVVHATFVFDRDRNKVFYYYDGLLCSVLDISIVTGNIFGGEVIDIGNIAGWKLDGKLFLFRIYNRALTDEEIMQNYIVSKHTFGL